MTAPKPKYQKLKSIGYGTLGVLAALVILAVSVALSFAGAGFLLAQLNPAGGWENFVSWFGNSLATSLIVGPILSIYPIIKLTGPIFAQAKANW
ncbi:MAG: hypothetical protein P0S96_00200 [Simkaniaceae bacterium]|nr:hypothetical protein [Candidatus Sacchlamyda saccharinae]